MANPILWAAEGLQKTVIKTAGKGRMVMRTLGGAASGSTTREAVEKIGKETGEALGKVDARRTARRDIKKAYNRSVKEARSSSSSAAREAIERNTQPIARRTASTNPASSDYTNMFRNGDNIYRYQVGADGQTRTYQTRTKTDKGWSAWEDSTSTEYNRALQEHLDIAQEISQTGPTDNAGVNLWQFVSDYPVISTAGLLGGGMLLGEFLDED